MKDLRARSVGVMMCVSMALLGCACSSIKVQHVADPAANLGAMKTFAIVPNHQPILTDSMLMGLPLRVAIEQSIAKALEARGRTATSLTQAQMIVRWVANIDYSEGRESVGTSPVDLRREFAAQDYVYNATDSGSIPYLVANGAIAVDIEDAQTKKSVWRGVISGVVKERSADPKRQQRLDDALARLFKSVPMR